MRTATVFVCVLISRVLLQEVMRDPVILEDGHTYEREAIEEWLETKDTSPMTNQKLISKRLTNNLHIKHMIKHCGLLHPMHP